MPSTVDSVQGDGLMNVAEVADALGVTVGRVRQLATSGKLKGEKVGRDWVFRQSDIAEYQRRPRRPGRPRKVQ